MDTKQGVIKCRTVNRLPADRRWDAQLFEDMEGATWQPSPGHKGDHVPVEVKPGRSPASIVEEDDDSVSYGVTLTEECGTAVVRARGSTINDLRVTHNGTETHGPFQGFPRVDTSWTAREHQEAQATLQSAGEGSASLLASVR